jgi:hypothetical protein
METRTVAWVRAQYTPVLELRKEKHACTDETIEGWERIFDGGNDAKGSLKTQGRKKAVRAIMKKIWSSNTPVSLFQRSASKL